MNELIVFLVQIAIAFFMSLLVLHLLNPFLRDVLRDTCGTEHSADFWTRFTQLMMVIAPLVIVIFNAELSSGTGLLQIAKPAYILQQTMLQTLLGSLVGLMFVGRIIYRAVLETVERDRAALQPQTAVANSVPNDEVAQT